MFLRARGNTSDTSSTPGVVPAVQASADANRAECTLTGGNNTPEEATVTATERQRAQIPDITPEEATITDTERFSALVQVMLHYCENDLLEEQTSLTTVGASSMGAGASYPEEASRSPEVGESSSRAGELPQEAGVSLSGDTPAFVSLGYAHSTTAGAAPDVPHHETANTRLNPSVEETFATGVSRTTPPATCVDFNYTDKTRFGSRRTKAG